MLRKKPETMTAEDYLTIDDKEDTGSCLTDDQLIEVTSRYETPEEKEEDDPETQDTATKNITLTEARGIFRYVIPFCEQFAPSTGLAEDNESLLGTLWAYLGKLESLTTPYQTTFSISDILFLLQILYFYFRYLLLLQVVFSISDILFLLWVVLFYFRYYVSIVVSCICSS